MSSSFVSPLLRRLCAVFVILLNPLAVSAGAHGGDPLGVVQIPAHRLRHSTKPLAILSAALAGP